jgi:hypothetical protein
MHPLHRCERFLGFMGFERDQSGVYRVDEQKKKEVFAITFQLGCYHHAVGVHAPTLALEFITLPFRP